MQSQVSDSNQTVIRAILFSIGVLLLIWLLFVIRNALVILFISYLLAAALYPAVEWLQARRFGRGVSIAFFYLVFVGVVSAVIAVCLQLVMSQGAQLISVLPQYWNKVAALLGRLPGVAPGTILSWRTMLQQLATHAYGILSSTAWLAQAIGAAFFGLLSVLVLTFYMLLQSRQIEEAILQLVPPGKRRSARIFLNTISSSVGRYLRAQTLVATTIGGMVLVGLLLLHVPFAPLLAIITFLFEFVPIVGAIAAAVLAFVVALAQSPMLALWTLLMYLFANQLEQNFLSPYILGRAVGIPTFWVLASILCGSMLYGVAGIYLALPSAVIIKLSIEHGWIKRQQIKARRQM